MITVVGLGYNAGDLTAAGQSAVKAASKVFVRTFVTKAGKAILRIRKDALSFDEAYEQAEDFGALNALIEERLLGEGDCVFCVDGSGATDEVAVKLQKEGKATLIAGVGLEEHVLSACPSTRYTSVFATDILAEPCFYAPDGDLIVKEIDDAYLAAELKLRLLDCYGDREALFFREGVAESIRLSELDRQKKYGNTASLLIGARAFTERTRFNFTDLMKIIFILRAPDGCPWDRVQTHSSIRNCCLEEAYELVEAIDLDDLDKMTEEAGDVLLQGLFHASIAEATGEFTVTDVVSGVCNKLIHRHLHIFGSERASNDKEAYDIWEKAKAHEKAQRTYTERMQQVAAPLPALMKAAKVQKIAKKAGFYSRQENFYEQKVQEELREFKQAKTQEEREEEAGDALFALAALIAQADVEPELALMGAIKKYETRFAKVEALAKTRGIDLRDLSEEELLTLYREVKNDL